MNRILQNREVQRQHRCITAGRCRRAPPPEPAPGARPSLPPRPALSCPSLPPPLAVPP